MLIDKQIKKIRLFIISLLIFSCAASAIMGFLSIIILRDSGLGTAFFTFVLVIITGIYAYFTQQSVKISQDYLFFENQEKTRKRIIEITKGILLPIKKTLQITKESIDNQFYFKITKENQIIIPYEKTEKYIDGEVLIVVSEINPHNQSYSQGYYSSAKHLLNYSDEILESNLSKLKDYNKQYNDYIEKLNNSIPTEIFPKFKEFKEYCLKLPLMAEGPSNELFDQSFLNILSAAFNQEKIIKKTDPIYRLYNPNNEKIIQWIQRDNLLSDYSRVHEKEIKQILAFIDEYTDFLEGIISQWKDLYSLSESEIQEHIQVPINYHCLSEDR